MFGINRYLSNHIISHVLNLAKFWWNLQSTFQNWVQFLTKANHNYKIYRKYKTVQ